MVGDELVQPIVGCLGFPVAGNATQFVAERALRGTGSDWRVVTSLVQPSLLEDAIRGARAMRFGGLAFTEAHQAAAALAMDTLTTTAQASGIIQAAKRSEEAWIGTDLRGDAILRLHLSLPQHPDEICVIGDEKLSDVVRLAFPSHNPGTLPIEAVPPSTSSKIDSIGTLVIAGAQSAMTKTELKSLVWNQEVTVILLDDESQQTSWREWAQSRDFRFLSPKEYQAMMLVEMLRFWTSLDIPVNVVRDALDEYHGW